MANVKKRLKKIIPLSLAAMMGATSLAACSGGVTGYLDPAANEFQFGLWTGEEGITRAAAYDWKDGTYKTSNYSDEYLDKFFFSDQQDAVTYAANKMYQDYGYLTASNQPYVGLGVGWAPAWHDWITLTRNWSDNVSAVTTWRQYIVNIPLQEDGYVWSYDTPHWPDIGNGENCANYHYDTNFCYVLGICNYVGWENSLALLSEVDRTNEPLTVDRTYNADGTVNETATAVHQAHVDQHSAADDASKGKTVEQKMNMALSYIETLYDSTKGLIVVTAENGQDGNNLGYGNNHSSNYWDNLPYGYLDAYNNVKYYELLNAMVEFETFRGNTTKAAEYKTRAATVYEKFNSTFWNGATGRYFETIDASGNKYDHGATFLNMEIVAAGLADGSAGTATGETKAELIYQWIDGDRTVTVDAWAESKGKGATGDNIYQARGTMQGDSLTYSASASYRASGVGASPRTNTISYDYGYFTSNANNGVSSSAWWHDNVGSQALTLQGEYGFHLENGGSILFTEYYDIMGRIKMGDVASAYDRFEILASEYAHDELNRDPTRSGSTGNITNNAILGYAGEYSENGLVPTAYLYGFVGLSQMAGGLKFDPNIPDGYKYMGASNLQFGGKGYRVTAYKSGEFSVECETGLDITVKVKDTANLGERTLTFYDEDNHILSMTKVTAVDGYFTLELKNVTSASYAKLR